jgi:uncharacterized protein YbaR (Trm112 family)
MNMDDQFLDLLGNPNDLDRARLVKVNEYLICSKTGSGFPITDGIPQLLPESEISADEMKEIQKNK